MATERETPFFVGRPEGVVIAATSDGSCWRSDMYMPVRPWGMTVAPSPTEAGNRSLP